MQIISGIESNLNLQDPFVAIGNFDGVHLGHQKICRRVVALAKQKGGTPAAITFEPHPLKVLKPKKNLKTLTTLNDKARLLADLGIKTLMIIPFDKNFSQIEPETFIRDILVEKIGIKWLAVGYNFTFGEQKKGNVELLRIKAKKYGFGFTVVRYAKIDGKIISSTEIRKLLGRGDVFETAKMLGRAYHISGRVTKGTGRGSSILNIPTANIEPYNEIIPKNGVYAVKVSISKASEPHGNQINYVYDGVMNIGNNPTFGDINKLSIEVHLLGFEGDLLAKELTVHFIERIRDEKKFSTLADLKNQIAKDILKSMLILERTKIPLFGV